MSHIRKIRSLTHELDELRTRFLVKDKHEHFSKGVSAGIIISLNYISDYFPDAYNKWSKNHLDERVKRLINKNRGKIHTEAQQK